MNSNQQVVDVAGSDRDENGMRRLMVAGLAFVAFEAVLMVFFSDYFYADIASTLGACAMIGVAAAGYFALGFYSRSWASGFLLAVMLLIAVAIGKPGPVYAIADGSMVAVHQNPGLDSLWLTLSFVFIPAWALGLLTAKLRG